MTLINHFDLFTKTYFNVYSLFIDFCTLVCYTMYRKQNTDTTQRETEQTPQTNDRSGSKAKLHGATKSERRAEQKSKRRKENKTAEKFLYSGV